MENKKATLYIEFRHNQARLDLIGNTHVALKECVKPYGIRNHTYQRDITEIPKPLQIIWFARAFFLANIQP